MKMDRLIGILSILLQREQVTAPELAAQFERLLFRWGFPDADSVLSWILTFGDGAELLEPAELREQLGALVRRLAQRYTEEG